MLQWFAHFTTYGKAGDERMPILYNKAFVKRHLLSNFFWKNYTDFESKVTPKCKQWIIISFHSKASYLAKQAINFCWAVSVVLILSQVTCKQRRFVHLALISSCKWKCSSSLWTNVLNNSCHSRDKTSVT